MSTAVSASPDFATVAEKTLLQKLARLMSRGLSLWVEEGQLQLSGSRALVDEDLVESLRSHKQLVIEWLRAEGFENRYYPLSFGQRRLWYLHSLSADNRRALNVTFAFGIRGEFDVARAQLALEELLRRQSSLRTAYHLRLHEPMQTLVSEVTLPLVIRERGHLLRAAGDQLDTLRSDVNQIAIQQSAIEFDLENPPLIRANILRYAKDLHAVVISLHHIACDGWSLGVLFRDFIALYLRDSIVPPIDLPVLEKSYADFACDQLQRFSVAESQRQLDFWRESLAGVDHELKLRPDFPRPAEQSRRGAREIVHLDADLLEALRVLSRNHEATLFTTLLTCYGIMLHQQSGQRDFVVGTDVANRNSAADADLVGFFVNVVPVRAQFEGDPRFTELLALFKRRLMAQIPYQEFPLERVVDGLKIPRNSTQSPLVQALFVLQN
ncbi:MAG: condensation domain-containing protein, partial [Pseudomonadota bacterium]